MTAAVAERSIGAELALIAKGHRGNLPAKAVVDWARKHPGSELHQQFDWDDTEAAAKWRLLQARNIILRVVVEIPDSAGATTRAWVNLPSDRAGGGVYRPIVSVMSNAAQREELLAMVKDDLGRLRRKHADLTELASVWRAVDKTTARRK